MERLKESWEYPVIEKLKTDSSLYFGLINPLPVERKAIKLREVYIGLIMAIADISVATENIMVWEALPPSQRDYTKRDDYTNQVNIAIIRSITEAFKLVRCTDMEPDDILVYYDNLSKEQPIKEQVDQYKSILTLSYYSASMMTNYNYGPILYQSSGKLNSYKNGIINMVAWEIVKDLTYLKATYRIEDYQKVAMSAWLQLFMIINLYQININLEELFTNTLK